MDSVEIELTPEQIEAAMAERARREKAVLTQVEKKIETAVAGMKAAHARGIANIRQYEGKPREVGKTKVDYSDDGERSGPPVLQATRSKTDLVEARMSDMLLTDSQAQWRLEREPVQNILPSDVLSPEEMMIDGQPMDGSQIKALFDERIESAVREQEKVIRDQFTECNFPAISRKIIRDSARIHFGAMIGPVDTVKRREIYSRSEVDGAIEVSIRVEESTVPGFEYADPFMCFPEPVDDLAKATYFAYLELLPESELRDLAHHPNANVENIEALIRMKTIDHGSVGPLIEERNKLTGFTEQLEGRYPVWRFYGAMTYDDMKAIGCDCNPLDPPPMIQLWMCMGRVLIMKPSSIKQHYRIPFHALALFPDVGSWVGLGVPWLCRDSARTAQGAWEVAMLNAAVSAGVIVFHRGKLQFSDGVSEINGPKFVQVENDDMSLSDQIHGEVIPNNIEQSLMFVDRALAQMDEDINLPQWTNPEVNKPTNTASGMAMWANAQTVGQRRSAAAFDDFIKPAIQAVIKWNKQHSDNPAFQVDVQVIPLGQAELLVKDVAIQNAMTAAQLSGPGGPLEGILDREVLGQHIAQKFELPEKAVLTADQRKERAENQPPDPAMAAEQARIAAAEREAALAEARLQADIADKERDDAFRREDRELDHEERMQEIALKRELLQLDILKLQHATAMKEMEIAQNKELNLAQIQARIQTDVLRKETAEFQAAMKARVDAEKIAASDREMRLKISPINPTNTGI